MGVQNTEKIPYPKNLNFQALQVNVFIHVADSYLHVMIHILYNKVHIYRDRMQLLPLLLSQYFSASTCSGDKSVYKMDMGQHPVYKPDH